MQTVIHETARRRLPAVVSAVLMAALLTVATLATASAARASEAPPDGSATPGISATWPSDCTHSLSITGRSALVVGTGSVNCAQRRNMSVTLTMYASADRGNVYRTTRQCIQSCTTRWAVSKTSSLPQEWCVEMAVNFGSGEVTDRRCSVV